LVFIFSSHPYMDLRADLKAIFYQLGFSLVGFTRPEPLAEFPVYRDWVASGLHAGMSYLAEPRALERRANPSLILPDARTVVVLALPYDNPAAAALPSGPRPNGRIAAYAWGKDYHYIIPPRLESALAQMERLLGFRPAARGYTDTGSILERSFAQRAGLGWIGKNTCLIAPGLGSYFLLAELFLAVEVEPDAPFVSDQCGTCTRCIAACPTGCIRPDRTLDAGRCISYLTIENKGAIPPDLRAPMGDWVFGCDICQQVCPWNIRFARPKGDPAFTPPAEMGQADLIAELQLSPQEFNRKFKGTPLVRAKRRGYLRNLAVALGNAGDPAAVSVLAACLLDEPEPLVRAHAAWALGRLNTPAARDGLAKALAQENDLSVRDEIISARG
jgi:epoxyqueuosine reductase